MFPRLLRSLSASSDVLIVSGVNGFLITGYEREKDRRKEAYEDAPGACYDLNYFDES